MVAPSSRIAEVHHPGLLGLLQDLRRSLLEPPRQLRPRTASTAEPGDQAETVKATA
jgi:hypothetical protein